MPSLSIQEIMAELDRRENRDAADAAAMTGQPEVLYNSPRYAQIRAILNANPILVGPCLNWLQEKLAGINLAQLRQLYTDEQIQLMRDQVEK